MPSILQVALLGSLAAACNHPDAPDLAEDGQTGRAGTKTVKTVNAGPTPPTTEFVAMSDPVENAFSMSMPKGWHNRIYSARVFDTHSMVMTTVSPDGSVLIFSGDPNVPQYWNPAAATPMHYEIQKVHPRMRIEPFVPAVDYFPGYVKRKFGKLADFKIVATAEDTESSSKLQKRFAEAGANMTPTAATVDFTYTDAGKPMRARILGTTVDSGAFWMVNASGIATTGDPKKYLPMMEALSKTHRMNPQWQAAQAQKHQERMAQMEAFSRRMTAQHNANMAAIQASAQAHQGRMQAIWSANDASMKGYYDRMASGDVQHRNFLNYINDEETVVGAGGKTHQVATGFQRYFVKKSDNTYVGGDIRMDLDKLRSMGLNPDDYEEVKIRN